ncbi:signal peptidase I [Candidatus Marsarchaeota G2 archaeon ECH_B_SAG-F08]|uniref:Signal peptidase I n=6 Tax=Candidatus Marsarchaeota TaxID=1978152 RepID=A0A2R6AJN6_9ARCH|nr:MAG: signal peptidase I [Candidatus Marsarchaeota G1 archaeon OSP_D]PSN86592.1 MAG: signal peptidase I [Candidatus Marsarchaeota G1 archaeon BE_D]PSN89655.1 MAG: signal peptidase I [Candidatus Marsarchaeota G1 archaeon OSP_C]PSN94739.1 MAG: signal peptidase I [Candidatus Marsarchaeota G1 archaeon OSP_B]PSN97292.1 MAG: signal peptidase I [Candidatus Marsarchaeota G2 archaeon ECH_B_SAG-F08]PSO05082.1 MAG: signal peptidase I [Candidatus Marsarchaeota G2 archaeon ECH_B_SAG-G16]
MEREKERNIRNREVFYFVLGIVLALLAVFGLGRVLHTNVPLAAVTSGSMTPAIKEGDLLVISGVNPNTLKIGNIIVYCSTDPALKDCLIVHRIVYITRVNGQIVGFVTKGDNNYVTDNQAGLEPPSGIPPQDVVGKVIFVIPLVGFLVIFLKQPAGFAFVVFLAILYFVIEIRRRDF